VPPNGLGLFSLPAPSNSCYEQAALSLFFELDILQSQPILDEFYDAGPLERIPFIAQGMVI